MKSENLIYYLLGKLDNKGFDIYIRPIKIEAMGNEFINLNKAFSCKVSDLGKVKIEKSVFPVIKMTAYCLEFNINKTKEEMIRKFNEKLYAYASSLELVEFKAKKINVNYRSKIY